MSSLIPGDVILDLLPRDLRAELCIVGIATSGQGEGLRFRMDPGRAFERFGTIEDVGGDWYSVEIRERYRPSDQLVLISGAFGMSAPEVPDELRGAAGRAYSRTATNPHWRDAFHERVASEVLGVWQDTTADGIRQMTESLADLARADDAAYFAYAREDQYECVNTLPPDVRSFLSVTPQGNWSLHSGVETYPVEGFPNAAICASIGSPVLGGLRRIQGRGFVPPQVGLARRDLPNARLQGNSPSDGPSARAPARPSDGIKRNVRRKAR